EASQVLTRVETHGPTPSTVNTKGSESETNCQVNSWSACGNVAASTVGITPRPEARGSCSYRAPRDGPGNPLRRRCVTRDASPDGDTLSVRRLGAAFFLGEES